MIEDTLKFPSMETDEKCVFHNHSFIPPVHPKPAFTLQEDFQRTIAMVNESLSRVLALESDVKSKVECMLSHVTSDNVEFKKLCVDTYNQFSTTVRNEVNSFETLITNSYELFKKSMETDFTDFQKAFTDFKKTTLETVEEFENHVDTEIQEINTYFRDNFNTTVRQELREMKNSGELVELIETGVFVNMATKADIENLATKTELSVEKARINSFLNLPEGATVETGELFDIRIDRNGNTHETAGEAVRAQINELDESIEGKIKNFTEIKTSGIDLNTIVERGTYVIGVTNAINKPESITAGFLLKVELFNDFIIQTAIDMTASVYYVRAGRNKTSISFYGWQPIYNSKENSSLKGRVTLLENVLKGNVITESEYDLNTLFINGVYVIGTYDSVNKPADLKTGYSIEVRLINTFVVQKIYPLPNDNRFYIRLGQRTDGVYSWGDWHRYATGEEIEAIDTEISELKNQVTAINGVVATNPAKIVMFGDSITGQSANGHRLHERVAECMGATVYNCAFDGCRMGTHANDKYKPFSMWELADAIKTGDFSRQETNAKLSGMPAYFEENVNTLKSIDFSTVDIVVIEYGTNDFTGDNELDSVDNPYLLTSFAGALRYSIETILTAYPNLRILLVAPPWRYWRDENGNYTEDSDTRIMYGRKLYEFVEKTIEIANDYHLPVVNPYNEMGVNKFNIPVWFKDGTHPNENGQKILARLISNKIRGM